LNGNAERDCQRIAQVDVAPGSVGACATRPSRINHAGTDTPHLHTPDFFVGEYCLMRRAEFLDQNVDIAIV
jgi:hypothetical protein